MGVVVRLGRGASACTARVLKPTLLDAARDLLAVGLLLLALGDGDLVIGRVDAPVRHDPSEEGELGVGERDSGKPSVPANGNVGTIAHAGDVLRLLDLPSIAPLVVVDHSVVVGYADVG